MPVASVGGLALSVLYKHIKELIRQNMYEKSMEFIPLLEKIKIMLGALQPVIEEMEQKNRVLDRPDELKVFARVIKDGKELVDKLKEVDHWYRKPKYTKKLKDLDETLQTHILLLGVRLASETVNVSAIASIPDWNTTNMRMQMGSPSKEIKDLKGNIVDRMRDMQQNDPLQNQAEDGWSGVPEPPSFTVGLETHLDGVRKKPVEEGVSMALITGHPGSGKTTLAKSFCQDKRVKGMLDYFCLDLVAVKVIPEIDMSQIATISRQKALSGVENRSGDIVEGMHQTDDQVETSSSVVEAWYKRIADRSYGIWATLSILFLLISVITATVSPGTKWLVVNIGINYLGFNN